MAIRIPSQAWSHPIGVGVEGRPQPRPRVDPPMIDDGPWAGVPIGGIGAGSIGRTQRGDFARWHLRTGEHRFEPVAIDGFALWVGDGERRSATVLRTIEPPPGWGPALPEGAGTYRALFPRSWFEYEIPGCPLRVTEEQLSPVIPGDDAATSLPVGTWEWQLENPTERPIAVALLLSWRNDLARELDVADASAGAGAGSIEARIDATRAGLHLLPPAAAGARGTPGSMALVIEGGEGIELSAVSDIDPAAPLAAWEAFAADGRVGDGGAERPAEPASSALAGAVAARLVLAPGERRTLRAAIAWDLPVVEFGGGRRWYRRHTREHGVAGDGAWRMAVDAIGSMPAWRRAIEAWQAPILADPGRPAWYAAALFNELYFLVDGGTFWPDRPVEPLPGDVEPALAIIECFDYPFYNTLDVLFYASFAISRLWPTLEVGISRAFARTVDDVDASLMEIQTTGENARRKDAGALPHDLGAPGEDPLVRSNAYRYRDPNIWRDLNPKFVLQLVRDRGLDGDGAGLLRETWPAVIAAMDRLQAFDTDGDGLPEHGVLPDQTYDTWPMSGPSAYGGGLWLAALRAAAALAFELGDTSREVAWSDLLESAAASFERRLWDGRAYRYDGGGTATSDSLMADQLAGQWYLDVLDLGDIVPARRVESALRLIFERNVVGFGDGEMGAVNGTRPDGSIDTSSEQSQEVWIGTTYALAAFMIGRGLLEEGWQTARGAARVTYERGFWFRTPEAYDVDGNFRASLYMRPLAIWAIEDALERLARAPADQQVSGVR